MLVFKNLQPDILPHDSIKKIICKLLAARSNFWTPTIADA